MTPFARRRLELDALQWRSQVFALEQALLNCDKSIALLQGRILPRDRAFDLPYLYQRRVHLATQLGEAQARSNALEHQVHPAPDHYDRLRQQEALGIAILETFGR
jgi:hypothetical protein